MLLRLNMIYFSIICLLNKRKYYLELIQKKDYLRRFVGLFILMIISNLEQIIKKS